MVLLERFLNNNRTQSNINSNWPLIRKICLACCVPNKIDGCLLEIDADFAGQKTQTNKIKETNEETVQCTSGVRG